MKLGLIGYPIAHSLSPWIHSKLMEQQQVNGRYELYEFNPDQFNQNVSNLKHSDIDGFNITVPYKEAIMPFLDELDVSAQQLGAVNTVKRTNQGWVGYNTDGTGFVDSLKNRYPDQLSGGTKVLLLGSGGAAKGIYHSLLTENLAVVDVANRTVQKAEELVRKNQTSIMSQPLSLEKAERDMGKYDVIIHTTTVGMSPHVDESLVSMHNMKKGCIVSDIVYRPMETRLLKEAKAQGAYLHFGHEMLLQQAVYAFKIWTGTNPNALKLLDEFEKKLKGV